MMSWMLETWSGSSSIPFVAKSRRVDGPLLS